MMTLSARFSNANHGSRALLAAIALNALLVLPGCGIPPLRGPDPGAPVPQRFEDANNLDYFRNMPGYNQGGGDYLEGANSNGEGPGPDSAGDVRRGILASVTKPTLWFNRKGADKPDVGTTIVANYLNSAAEEGGPVRLAVGLSAADEEAAGSDDGAVPSTGESNGVDDATAKPRDAVVPVPGASNGVDNGAAKPGDGSVPSTGASDGVDNGAADMGYGAVPPPGESNGVNNEFTGGENSSYIPYYDFFDDPMLASLISQALSGNQELKILTQEIQIANYEVMGRSGAYLPFVTLGGLLGLDKPSRFTPMGAVEDQLDFKPGKSFPDPLPDFLGPTANLSWEIDIWRKLRNARDAASFRFLGTRDGQNYVVTRLIAEVAENYFQLMALDNRLLILDQTIAIQQASLAVAQAQKAAGNGTELGVQRFLAEVRKNQSEKLILQQQVIEVENRINFLLGRYPQHIERQSANFLDKNLHALSVGVPSQLLQNRPDVRQAERELAATGLDVRVARARFFPSLVLTSGVGLEAFNARYLLTTPESLIYNVAGEIVSPLINKRAIRADYLTANATQLQAVYKYQKTILNAFTEVINRMAKVQNYGVSIGIKKEQLASLQASVNVATNLYQAAQAEYVDVLLAQRDFMEARMVLVDTKQEQLSAIVNTYQALGGGGMQMNQQ